MTHLLKRKQISKRDTDDIEGPYTSPKDKQNEITGLFVKGIASS